MAGNKVEEIIEKYLQREVERGLNQLPGSIEPEMLAPGQETNQEWKTWLPIASTVTDKEVAALEEKIGCKLPAAYVRFLKYKHFYELHIGEAAFCRHPIQTWQNSLEKMIFDGYPQEYLYDMGLIPFADWSDWGLLCFDTRRNYFTADYPVVLWDHDVADYYTDYSMNFNMAIKKLDKEDEKSWAQQADEG